MMSLMRESFIGGLSVAFGPQYSVRVSVNNLDAGAETVRFPGPISVRKSGYDRRRMGSLLQKITNCPAFSTTG